jgi:ornithine decarboxylase
VETSHHYEFDLERFMTREKFERIKAFAADKETPCLIIDLDVIEKQYDSLKKGMPFAKIYYAVKANPLDDVVKLLVEKGSCFDIASVYELNQVLALGATPDRISDGQYGRRTLWAGYRRRDCR